MTKKAITAQPDRVALYERLLASVAGIETKSNFGSGYTAVNGNMYSMISKGGVVGIRLPEPQRSEFMARYKTGMFRGDPAWPPSKELVAVPDDLLRDTAALSPWLAVSFDYVQTLRPRPTTRSAQK